MKKDNRKKHQQNKSIIKKNTIVVPDKRNNSVIPLFIAFCVPVLLYLQTINFGFTYFDDDGLIIKNINFLKNFGNIHQAFLTDAFIIKTSLFYRPLQTSSYMVDIQLSGVNNAWMFHLTNILLFGFIACSLFLLLKKFLIPTKIALLGTLIYCVNPLFVSSIAWIPARGDLMLTLFSLLSFLFFIEFTEKKKILYLFLNWAAFTIALFCKETAAFLPFLFIIYSFTFSNEKLFDKKYLLNIFLYAISGILWFWLRSNAIGGNYDLNDKYGLEAILLNLPSIPESLSKFFLPFYFAPIPEFSVLKTLAGIIIISLLIILIFKKTERSKKEKIFCITWFFILIFPPMLFKHSLIEYLDHRFFLPLIGIFIFLLFLFPKKWLAKEENKISWIMIAIIIFLCSFTFIKSRDYSDPMTFYNSALSKNSNSAMAFNNRGHLKLSNGDLQGSIDDYSKAIAILPTYCDAYSNRGFIKLKMGDDYGAIADCNNAISINNKFVKAYVIEGVAKMDLGNFKDAISDFNKFISIYPNNAEVYGKRAIAKYNLKDFAGTIDDCNIALQINPNDQTAFEYRDKAQQELSKPTAITKPKT